MDGYRFRRAEWAGHSCRRDERAGYRCRRAGYRWTGLKKARRRFGQGGQKRQRKGLENVMKVKDTDKNGTR